MLAYYIVKFFSWVMCIAPKWLRSLTAALLGGLAVVATPKWRLQMAAANISECLGVDEMRARLSFVKSGEYRSACESRRSGIFGRSL